MSKSLKNQRGLTGISIAAILGLIAIVVMLTLKIMPIYLENFKIKESLASLQEEETLPTQPVHQIKNGLMKRLNINMVETVKREDIQVIKRGRHVKVGVSYEVVENIWGSLNVLAIFDDFIEVGDI